MKAASCIKDFWWFSVVVLVFLTSCVPTTKAPLVPLSEGMLNTIKLQNGEVVYDIQGEWNAVYYNRTTSNKDIIKITQEGNTFYGIKLIGNEYVGKNSKTIKGVLGKNGFTKIYGYDSQQEWLPNTGKIEDSGNRIVIFYRSGKVVLKR